MLELMIIGFRFSEVARKERSLLAPKDDSPPRLGARLSSLASHAFSLVTLEPERSPSEVCSCSKNPTDHQLVPYIIEKDENQWFISMLRDPRDVVVSRHGKRPDAYWANLRQWKDWADDTRPFRRHPRLIEVRYEDLVASPDAVQDRVAERLPFLTRARRFSEFHAVARPSKQSLRAMGSVRAVDEDSVGNWRNHLPRLAGQLQVHGSIAQDLIDFGYEEDAGWLQWLEGIEPDTTPGRWREFLSPNEVREIRKQVEAKASAYLADR